MKVVTKLVFKRVSTQMQPHKGMHGLSFAYKETSCPVPVSCSKCCLMQSTSTKWEKAGIWRGDDMRCCKNTVEKGEGVGRWGRGWGWGRQCVWGRGCGVGMVCLLAGTKLHAFTGSLAAAVSHTCLPSAQPLLSRAFMPVLSCLMSSQSCLYTGMGMVCLVCLSSLHPGNVMNRGKRIEENKVLQKARSK